MGIDFGTQTYKTNYPPYAGFYGSKTAERHAQVDDFYASMSYATEESSAKGTGDILGMTTIPSGNPSLSYGMVASYAQRLICQKLIANLENRVGDSVLDVTEADFIPDVRGKELDAVSETEYLRDDDNRITVSYTSIRSENSWDDPHTKQTEYSGYNGYTFYTKEGIFYLKSGANTRDEVYEDEVVWTVRFNSEDDYERAMDFLSRFPEGDSKYFAAHESFWTDFVAGNLDEEDFMDYYSGLDHGKVNVLISDENGNMRIDTDAIRHKYFHYFNLATIKPLSREDVQRTLEANVQALLRGEKYQPAQSKKSVQDILQEFFPDTKDKLFYFDDTQEAYGLQDWIAKLLDKTRGGMLNELENKKRGI